MFSPWPVATGPEVDALGDRAALVASVVDAIARGDAAEAFARLPPDVLRSKEESFWKEYWPRWIGDMGAYRGAELIGGTSEAASEEVVATWMRTEAGLLEATPRAVARLRGVPGEERLVLEVPIRDAAAALDHIGRRVGPLAREQANAPTTVINRPKGLPRPRRDNPND